jgi:hypothetical protein
MPSLKQQVLSLAKQLEIKVDYSGEGTGFEVCLACPQGKRFEAGRHTSVTAIWDDMTSRDCWRGALEDLKNGIESCEDPECEWCTEERD